MNESKDRGPEQIPVSGVDESWARGSIMVMRRDSNIVELS
jgi:hypothetical protein